MPLVLRFPVSYMRRIAVEGVRGRSIGVAECGRVVHIAGRDRWARQELSCVRQTDVDPYGESDSLAAPGTGVGGRVYARLLPVWTTFD